MNCKSCNNNIPDGAAFCPICGANTVVAEPQSQINNVPESTVNNAQPHYGYQQSQQPVQPNAQQGYGGYQQPPQQQGYGAYAPSNNAPVGYAQPGVPGVPPVQQNNAKKKMSPVAIIGIVIGGIVGVIILLSIVVALFSFGGGGGGGPYHTETTAVDRMDFEISDETDDQGRQLVLDYYTGEVIGYVDGDRVYIPYGDDEIICYPDGTVIYYPIIVTEDNNPDEPQTTDDGSGDYNPPPTTEGNKPTSDNGGGNTKPTSNKGNGNKNDNDKPASGGSSNNVSYDVVEFVEDMFGAVKLHETSFVDYCETQSYNEVDLVIFGVTGETKLVEDGYNAFSAYMTEDEYNKVKDLFPYDACAIYKKSEIEKKIKQIWGNKLAVEDFLSNDEFVSSKGYVIVEELPGSGDGAEHYFNAFSQEIKGDHIVVKVNMVGYGWYDGSLWDATNYSGELANIGAENSPSSYTEAIERGSVNEAELGYITLYLKNTSDGLKLDYME